MTVARFRGQRAVQCSGCGEFGPRFAKAGDARSAAKLAGWGRSYPRGRGEDFYCPTCRTDRKPGPKPREVA